MKEIVRYHNHFNSITFKNFNNVEFNLFMAICSKIRDKGSEEIILNFSELKEMVKYKHRGNARFLKDLEQIYKKLITLSVRIETKEIIDNFVLFTRYRIIKEEQTVSIKVNEDFAFLLNNLVKRFTQFELEEFINLKSNYSKEIYRRLKQFKSTGFWKIKMDNFKELMNIPPKYRMSDIDKYVLKISKNELENYFDNFKIIKLKKGRKIEALEFRFSTDKKLEISETETIEKENKLKKSEIEPQKRYKIIENTPKIEEKEKTLSEQIKEELKMEQEALNRSTTLLGAYIAGLKDVTNNSIIIDSKRRINLRKEKIEKLEQFSNLTDDEIDESLEKEIRNMLEMEIK